jgi:hypothetical protein
MKKRYWRIQGRSSLRLIFEETIPVGCVTIGQLKELLKCLAAKDGLTHEEIVGSYVKKKTKKSNSLLEVTKESGGIPAYYCGETYHVAAVVVDEAGNRVEYPSVHDV